MLKLTNLLITMLVVVIGLGAMSCSTGLTAGKQLTGTTVATSTGTIISDADQDYADGKYDYENNYAKNRGRSADYIRGYDEAKPASSATSSATNVSAWSNSKYSVNRNTVKLLSSSIKSAINNSVEGVELIGGDSVLVIDYADDEYDDGRIYYQVDADGNVIVSAPSQPGNRVKYFIDGKKGFEVLNRKVLGTDRNIYCPISYQGTTSFLGGDGSPSNKFYTAHAERAIRETISKLPGGEKWRLQNFGQYLGNAVKHLLD